MSAAKHLPLLALLFMGGCTLIQQAQSPEMDAERRLQQGFAALDAGHYAEAFDDLAWVYSRCAGFTASHQALAGLAAMELDPRNRAGREAVGSELLGRLVQHPGPPTWTRPLNETAYLMALALGAPATPGTGATPAGDSAPPTGSPRIDAAAAAGTAVGSPATPADGPGAASLSGSTTADPPVGTPIADAGARARLDVPAGTAGQDVRGCGRRVATGDGIAPRLPTLPGPSVMSILSRTEAQRAALASRTDSLSQALTTALRELEETRAELERIRKTLTP